MKLLVRKMRGPLTAAVLCLAPVVLWVVAAPLDERFSSLEGWLESIGGILGLIGVCSFALNLFVGARWGPVEAFFAGLDRMYAFHRINGRIAFLMLLSHAVFIFSSRAVMSLQSAFDLLLPQPGWTVFFGVLALVGMAVTIYLTLYVRLQHETFVYVQRGFGFVFLLGLVHVFRTPGTKAFSPELTYYLALVYAVGLAGFAYRSLLGDYLVPRKAYRVTRVDPLDESVMEITMTSASAPIRFVPGQFVFVTFRSETMSRQFHPLSVMLQGQSALIALRAGEVRKQFHPFSITSSSREDHLSVAVKAVGDYTRAMRWLEEGAEVLVEGPYGAFSHEKVDNKKQIWIAGGIGITPFLSMARSLESDAYEIDLYYCTRPGDPAYFIDELFDIADRHLRLRVIHMRRDFIGRLTSKDIEGASGGVVDKDILICGPEGMVENLRAGFIDRGVPRARIHFERFRFGP